MQFNLARRSFLAVSLFITFSYCWAGDEPLDVIYPNINGLNDGSYGYAVLKLALDASKVPYRLTLNNKNANNSRIRQMLSNGQITIADFGTSTSFENDFTAIQVPLDFGVSGWRLLAMHKDNLHLTENIHTVSDLEALVLGQGAGWSDVEILNKAGLRVMTAPKLDHLFHMLAAKRFEALPLGANEIYALVESRGDRISSVRVDSSLLIVYPFARLFFVKNGNTLLHDTIKSGLERAFDDGSLWDLFRNHPHNAALFEKTALHQRRVLEINDDLFKSRIDKIPSKYFKKMIDFEG